MLNLMTGDAPLLLDVTVHSILHCLKLTFYAGAGELAVVTMFLCFSHFSLAYMHQYAVD
jgi:hypothetical protein